MSYVASYLKSLGHEVKQLDLAVGDRLDLRTTLGIAECSRTTRVMLRILFRNRFPLTAEELHRDLMTPEVKHVSILPPDYSVRDAENVLDSVSSISKLGLTRIRQIRADVVGFHLTWDSTLLSLFIARELKENDKDLRIVFGGPDCSRSFRGELIAHLGFVDAVATGEGERTFRDLLDAWRSGGEAARKVKGCFINMKEKGVRDNGEAELIENLDSLPFPDYSDLPLRSYTAFYALPVLTSRGCRYRCSFCVDRAAIWRGTYRERSIGNVVREIIHLRQKYGVKAVYFCDSALNPSIRRLTRLCDGFAEVRESIGKDIYWGGDIRASPMTRDLLKRMYEVGCRFLMFGAESASREILTSMHKGVTSRQMAEVFRWAKESGIWVFTYWIVGYPGEKEKDLLDSIRFLINNADNIDEACIAPCEVGYGSELSENRKNLEIRFLRSSISLGQELRRLERYSRGYKAWVDRSNTNTPMERLHRRMIFEAVARSLGYPSNWAIWPPMPPIDKLEPGDVPYVGEYIVSKVETVSGEQELHVIPESTMEPMRITALQLQALELADGTRTINEISRIIHEKSGKGETMNGILEECSRLLANMVRNEIVRLKA